MVITGLQISIPDNDLQEKNVFCKSSITLGDGKIESIKDLIIIREDTFDTSKTKEIANEVSIINKKFKNKNNYIIAGPGRWGSADPWLGIPVQWQNISQAKAIIEVGLEELPIDPSFGSHFFQNITSLHVAYFTINPKNKKDYLNLDWLKEENLVESKKYTKWYQFENPIKLTLNGTTGDGEICIPSDNIINVDMDEEESTGI